MGPCDRRLVRIGPALAVLVSLTLLSPSFVLADDGDGVLVRRAVPDLDGRPPSDEDPVLDALLWIPRVLTSPLYLISEYVIRQPLGALLTALEEEGVIDALFASGGNYGVLPTMLYEFGLSPSFGLYGYVGGWPFEANRLSVHAATFGEDWLRLIVRDRVQITPEMDFALRVELRRRPDQLVEGIGYNAPLTPRTRFGVDQVEARMELSYRPWRRSGFNYQAGYRSVDFADRGWNGEPSAGSIERVAPLVSFDTGYELLFFRGDFLIDTHDPQEELTRSRFRLRLIVEQNAAFGGLTAGPRDALFTNWVRWGGEVAASTDFLGRGRAFMLRLRADGVTPLDDGPVGGTGMIPFYELPDAGGKGPLPGFITGQLRGGSVIGLTLEYVWPVYAFVDGSLHVSVGNAFGVHYEDFAWDRLRISWGVGLVPRFAGEHLVEISVDVGTETFARGAEITTARVVVGARHGL